MSGALAASDPPIDKRPARFHGSPKGGRPPGRKNNATLVREKFAKDGLSEAEALGMSPLAIMLLGVRDPKKVSNTRFERAKAAAPYVHATYRAVEFRDTTPRTDVLDLSQLTAVELSVLRKVLTRKAPAQEAPVIEAMAEESTTEANNEDGK